MQAATSHWEQTRREADEDWRALLLRGGVLWRAKLQGRCGRTDCVARECEGAACGPVIDGPGRARFVHARAISTLLQPDGDVVISFPSDFLSFADDRRLARRALLEARRRAAGLREASVMRGLRTGLAVTTVATPAAVALGGLLSDPSWLDLAPLALPALLWIVAPLKRAMLGGAARVIFWSWRQRAERGSD